MLKEIINDIELLAYRVSKARAEQRIADAKLRTLYVMASHPRDTWADLLPANSDELEYREAMAING